ncbi:hypothetical protein R3P38DRAFT_3280999 [Favolaschia claudopus]|uniref:Uncharacterized protein n=1 Tax=Favolaschia claudopus TaxID=2862362 RepID=A0AAW0AFD5_9AGAR
MPRRSLLPRKYPVHPNDDEAEKRLRREAAKRSEEVATRTLEKIPIPATITEEAMDKVIQDIVDGLQEIHRELPEPEHFRPKLLRIDALETLTEEDRLREEQGARNWESWTQFVLDSMREPERQQILREWRAQDESERKWELDQARWEEEQAYAGDLSSSSAKYWVPTAVRFRVLVVALEKIKLFELTLPKQLYFNRRLLDLAADRGERFLDLKYPPSTDSVLSFSIVTYDRVCPYRCRCDHRWPCRTLINSERVEAEWAEISRPAPDRKEMGPGMRHDHLDWMILSSRELLLSNSWSGLTLVGGPLPRTSVGQGTVDQGRDRNVEINVNDSFARVEEIDEDYLPELESVEYSSEEDDSEGEREEECGECGF